MRTWYIYRTRRSFTPVAGNISFRFREDRKTFSMQNCDILWRDTTPIVFEQLMVEAELTRKYKA